METPNETYVTVITFNYPGELPVPCGLLEAEGIVYVVQDELTVQVSSYYSNAVGGVKVQVREEDVQRAIEVLKAGGFIFESEQKPSAFIAWIDKVTAMFLPARTMALELRIVIFAALVITVIGFIFYFASL